MSPSREARSELHRYVESRKRQWTFADKTDAIVALACAILFVWLVL